MKTREGKGFSTVVWVNVISFLFLVALAIALWWYHDYIFMAAH